MIKDSVYSSESFGIIGNDFINNADIKDVVLAVYITMRTLMYDSKNSCSVITLMGLYELLNVDSKQGNQTKEIKFAINYLIDNKYIEIYDLLHSLVDIDYKSNKMYKVSFLHDDEDGHFILENGFSCIPSFNLFKIIEYIKLNKGIKKYQLIRYYLVIARATSNVSKFGNISMQKLGDIIGISPKTCVNNNTILSDIGVIFYNNSYGHIRNGVFKMDCTMFAHRNTPLSTVEWKDLYLDEDMFKQLINERVKELKVVEVDKINITNNRSESMKKVWEKRRIKS